MSGDSHLTDSDIGGLKRKPFSFASSEVARGCESSICVRQVAQIGKPHELGNLLVENPSIGYSKLRVAKR
jgi:hypothetical protein